MSSSVVVGSITPDARDAVTAVDDALTTLGALDWDALPVGELCAVIERFETTRRRATVITHHLALSLDGRDEAERGGPGHKLLADVARLSPKEARRRIRDAEQLAPRTSLTGQPLPPALPATATAWNAGILDPEHLRTIQSFLRDLPTTLHPAEVEKAETFLAEKAAELRPDQLEVLADRLALTLNPDGTFSDADRANRRGFIWCGRQRRDGMSVGKLTATPELRATIDALLAKFAAPGMCNPADQTPTVNDEPTQEVADRDARGHAQRQHDALAAILRAQLGDPKLGQHNGLPVTVIVSATLEQLQTGAGVAVTGGGSLLPMSDLIRMASHAWHYLCVFDTHTARPLYLGRSKRIASADQRIVLHAKDRGCSAPGCHIPGYLTQVHHVNEWATGGLTNIDDLTFACKTDHPRLTTGGWTTRKLENGQTQWIPPPHLPLKPATNDYHHPERLLPKDPDHPSGPSMS